MRVVLGLVCLLLATTSCGEPLPTVPHHGLRVADLPSRPTGVPLRIGAGIDAGRWEADVLIRWSVRRSGGAPETGRARVLLTWTVARTEGERLRAQLAVEVREPEGLGGRYVSEVNGLAVTYDLDGEGRPLGATLRFGAKAPPEARRFLDGLWLAGFGLGRRWVPSRPVRVGEAWPRSELGALGELTGVSGVEVPDPTSTGGGRLEGRVASNDGERVVVALASLAEVEGPIQLGLETAAVSIAVLGEGTATLGLSDGVPRRWSYTEETRYLADDGITRQELHIRQEVEGTARPVR